MIFWYFQPPEKADPWEEVFVADTLGNQCVQNPEALLWLTHPGWDKIDEDCLNLNIFAPQVRSCSDATVLVLVQIKFMMIMILRT